jgi:putative FmdB family regulatory protein
VPIYDYLCSNCGERTEVIHGISEPGPRFCPACGADGTLRKAFALPAVHFKGSGWAKKDRSSAGTKSRSKADAGSDSGASKSDASGGGDAPSSSGSTPAASDGSSSGGSSSGGSSSGGSSSASDSAR